MSKSLFKRIAFFVFLIGFALFLSYFFQTFEKNKIAQNSNEINRVKIGNIELKVELALTPEERQRGLSGHELLKEDEGMLFVFDKNDTYGFWMKDMLFPIDILWIDELKRVVYIEKEVLPETFPKIFIPDKPSLYVLEISAGLSNKNSFKIGDKIEFLK